MRETIAAWNSPRPWMGGRASERTMLALCLLLLATPGRLAAQLGPSDSVHPRSHKDRLPLNRGAAALWQSLQALHTRASLLMVTAHPDDEDGGTLTYESRHEGARTALFTLNRGEGGQNEMSSADEDALGLIRTQELLEADRYYGSQQYWSRVADFGFSKTKEEAYQKWGYDRVFYDAVRVVRLTRPLVVVSPFVGYVSDGHGQHQVAGQMAQEVYKAAGDPKVFPDQIQAGLLPWSPVKVYERAPFARITAQGIFDYATNRWAPVRFPNYIDGTTIDGAPATNVSIPAGDMDPFAGLTYVQIARQGLARQKTQIAGLAIPFVDPFHSDYHRYASRVPASARESSFFSGIDTSIPGIADLAPANDAAALRAELSQINAEVESAIHSYSAVQPDRIAPQLAAGMRLTESLIESVTNNASLDPTARYNILFELNVKKSQFNQALGEALGIHSEALVAPIHPSGSGPYAAFAGSGDTVQNVIAGQPFGVVARIADRSSLPVTIESARLQIRPDRDWSVTARSQVAGVLQPGDVRSANFSVVVSAHPTLSQPYFTRPNVEQAYYNLTDPRYQNLSALPYPVSAWFDLSYAGAHFTVGNVVQTVHRAPGTGVVYEPLTVAPAISVSISPQQGLMPLDHKSLTLTATVHSNVQGQAEGAVHLNLPAGWTSAPPAARFHLEHAGEDQTLSFVLTPARLEAAQYKISAIADYDGKQFTDGYQTEGYPGIPPAYQYRKAISTVNAAKVEVAPGLRVGYILGTGDDVPAALEDLGIHVHILTPQELATGDLSQFNAILVGIRAYDARPEVNMFNGRLLAYVHGGGTLIVQYNRDAVIDQDGPYPFSLGPNPEKVIDETSRVDLLHPDNPILSVPNRITEQDFSGWIEERGHGFMQSWDPRYTPLVSTHDQDEDPQRGGLLYAKYGQGNYVYLAFALYRQLPAGVPGAYRIIANLLSLGARGK